MSEKMISRKARFQSLQIHLKWGDPRALRKAEVPDDAPNSDWDQVYLADQSSNAQRNLFDIPTSYLFGLLPKFSYDNLESSFRNNGEIIEGCTDALDFRMQNGVLEVCESMFFRDDPQSPPSYGKTYIDYNNVVHYCEKYASAYRNKRDEAFHIFCFHVD